MFFTIEPMINLGKPQVKILSDGWTAVTRDRSLSAQFEHALGVTATGAEIFTLSPRGLIASALCTGRMAAGADRGSMSEADQEASNAGHRERLRERFLEGAPRPWPTTNCWSLCCFAPFRAATSSPWPRRC